MKNIMNVLILTLFITIIHGFPQQGQDTASPQIQDQRSKDTSTQTKPLDRSQISTLPATVDIKKQDTVPQNKDGSIKSISTAEVDSGSRQSSVPQNIGDSRKTRDTSTVDPNKKQDTFPHSTREPQTLDSYKVQNSGPQKSSEEINSRKTRGVENSKQRNPSDIEANRHQQPQTHQSRPDNRPSHLTKDIPVPSNAHHPHPGVETHNPKQH